MFAEKVYNRNLTQWLHKTQKSIKYSRKNLEVVSSKVDFQSKAKFRRVFTATLYK